MTPFKSIGNFFKTNFNNGNIAKGFQAAGSAAMNAAMMSMSMRQNNYGIFQSQQGFQPGTASGYPNLHTAGIMQPGADLNGVYEMFMQNLNSCTQTPQINPQNPSQSINQATLQNELAKTYKSDEFKNIVKNTIPNESHRKAVLEILSGDSGKIEVKNEGKNSGVARYDNRNGKIIINGSNLENANKDDLIKVLIHEAMHAAQKTNFNTQEEELLCETTAIRTRAALIAEGKSEDEMIYGKTYTELNSMSDEELKIHLQKNFIGSQKPGQHGIGPYSNRIIDKSGAVTIHDANGRQIPLDSGSEITINGKKYILGKEVFLEGMGAFAGTTCQLFKIDEQGNPKTIGIISFKDMQKLPFEENIPQVQKHLSNLYSAACQSGSVQSGEKNFEFKITDYNPNI